MTQPPKTHVKKGSGNIVYNKLSQTLECGTTNQITLFAINAHSAQFIMKIIFTKIAARMCHMVALVSRTCQKGSMANFSGQKTWSQSGDHLSVILELTAPSVVYSERTRATQAFPSPCLFVFKLQAFIGGKDVLVSLPTGYGKSLCLALIITTS